MLILGIQHGEKGEKKVIMQKVISSSKLRNITETELVCHKTSFEFEAALHEWICEKCEGGWTPKGSVSRSIR